MNLTIPDKVSKLVILLSIGIFIGCYYLQQPYEERRDNLMLAVDESRDNFLLTFSALNSTADLLKKKLKELNELLLKVSKEPEFKDYYSDEIDELEIEIDNIENNFNQLDIEKTIAEKKYDLSVDRFKNEIDRYSKIITNYSNIQTTSSILFMVGFIMLVYEERKDRLDFYDSCQSCGKKFTPLRSRGLNSDGTKNTAFCSSCFKKGKFKSTAPTFDEVKQSFMKEMEGKSRYRKWVLNRRFKNLLRWNGSEF